MSTQLVGHIEAAACLTGRPRPASRSARCHLALFALRLNEVPTLRETHNPDISGKTRKTTPQIPLNKIWVRLGAGKLAVLLWLPFKNHAKKGALTKFDPYASRCQPFSLALPGAFCGCSPHWITKSLPLSQLRWALLVSLQDHQNKWLPVKTTQKRYLEKRRTHPNDIAPGSSCHVNAELSEEPGAMSFPLPSSGRNLAGCQMESEGNPLCDVDPILSNPSLFRGGWFLTKVIFFEQT